MNKVMKLKHALNNTRYRDYPDRYFKPIHNLAQDFWSQDYTAKDRAVRRSMFMHAFVLAVVEHTAFMNGDEDIYDPQIAEALGDPEAALDLFDDVMRSYLPCMPDKRRVCALFRRVRAAK